jgi:acyl-CoA thioesterase I
MGNEQNQSVPHSPPERESRRRGTIAAVGDSLTAGFGVAADESYPALLERKLRDGGYDYRVINAGCNGEKSGEALARINQILSLKPDIVILQTGTNDGLRGVSPEEMKGNIRAIVRALMAHGITVVLAGMENLKRRKGEYDAVFARAYPEIAREQGVILIPLFLAGVAGEPRLNRGDGIHPTVEGYRIVVETVYPFVVEAIEMAREDKPTG